MRFHPRFTCTSSRPRPTTPKKPFAFHFRSLIQEFIPHPRLDGDIGVAISLTDIDWCTRFSVRISTHDDKAVACSSSPSHRDPYPFLTRTWSLSPPSANRAPHSPVSRPLRCRYRFGQFSVIGGRLSRRPRGTCQTPPRADMASPEGARPWRRGRVGVLLCGCVTARE